MKLLLILLALCIASPAQAYDYTADLHRDCLNAGLGGNGFTEPAEVVKVEPLTKAEALKRGLQYRAVSWGKLFPADEDGYFIAQSGEFIPQSWSVPSPDGNFYRGTYFLNSYWSGPPENKWKVRPHNDTVDGLPPTRCFWQGGESGRNK